MFCEDTGKKNLGLKPSLTHRGTGQWTNSSAADLKCTEVKEFKIASSSSDCQYLLDTYQRSHVQGVTTINFKSKDGFFVKLGGTEASSLYGLLNPSQTNPSDMTHIHFPPELFWKPLQQPVLCVAISSGSKFAGHECYIAFFRKKPSDPLAINLGSYSLDFVPTWIHDVMKTGKLKLSQHEQELLSFVAFDELALESALNTDFSLNQPFLVLGSFGNSRGAAAGGMNPGSTQGIAVGWGVQPPMSGE